jgi:two-component system OmpR family response regulator
MTKILLVEDDESLGLLLKQYLNAKGYPTELETDGSSGYKAFMRNQFDLCIFDVMMPVMDGFTLAKEVRSLNSDMPIIFLTAKSQKEDVMEGFRLGADDYLTKPFNMEELLARIEAILRRMKKDVDTNQKVFKIGKYLFDAEKQHIVLGENQTKLTTKEADLLKLLCLHSNRMLDRSFALKSIWRDDSYYNARSMDVYITKLRKLLKDDPTIEIINVHGKGFKLLVKTDEVVLPETEV